MANLNKNKYGFFLNLLINYRVKIEIVDGQ